MCVEDYALAEPIRVIVNLKNNGVTVYNVTDCMGSLNDVDDFSHYRQNVIVCAFWLICSSRSAISTALCTLATR